MITRTVLYSGRRNQEIENFLRDSALRISDFEQLFAGNYDKISIQFAAFLVKIMTGQPHFPSKESKAYLHIIPSLFSISAIFFNFNSKVNKILLNCNQSWVQP